MNPIFENETIVEYKWSPLYYCSMFLDAPPGLPSLVRIVDYKKQPGDRFPDRYFWK